MNIENMPEDELDELFRKSASEHEPAFEPEAWRAMEKKLDAHAQTQTLLKRLLYLGAILLLLGPAAYFGNQLLNKPADTEPGVISTNELTRTKTKKEFTANINPSKITEKGVVDKRKDPAKKKATPILNNPGKISPEKIIPGNPGALATTALYTAKTKAYHKNPRMGLPEKGGNYRVMAGKYNPTTTVGNGNQVNLPEENRVENLPDPVNRTTAQTLLPIKQRQELRAPELLPMPVLRQNIPGPDSTDKPKNSLNALTKFSLTVMAAPDLSTVGFQNPGGVSTNAGVAISYHFSDKLRFSTGVVKANKIYAAKPEDYQVAGYYWPGGYKPKDIKAVCQVLDIPVNIGYTLWQKNKNALTVQTGLSSYIMKREKYDYVYKSSYGEYTHTYRYANQNQHLFSIYNLSLGYSRQLSESISLGAEPFIKVPLSGVGAGNVKLSSAGVFFSLNYRYSK